MIADLQPGEVVVPEKIDRISRLPLAEAEQLIASIRAKGAKLAIPGVVDWSDLAAGAEGVARIVLESVQELLLKLALQMAHDDYETRRERQRQGIQLDLQGRFPRKGIPMPRRDYLTALQQAALVSLPEDEGEFIRRYSLTTPDLALIQQRHGDGKRLGFAIQLCHLRFPWQVLGPRESPDPRLPNFVAHQLGLDPGGWAEYAQRDETRREHLQLILAAGGYRAFSVAFYRELAVWLLPLAMQSDQSIGLAQTVLQELRSRKVIVPPIPVIGRLCAGTVTRALRQGYRPLTEPLGSIRRKRLAALFQPKEATSVSVLTWLRQPVAAMGPRHLMDLIGRLRCIWDLDLPPELANAVRQNRLLKLARTAEQSTSQHLGRF